MGRLEHRHPCYEHDVSGRLQQATIEQGHLMSFQDVLSISLQYVALVGLCSANHPNLAAYYKHAG